MPPSSLIWSFRHGGSLLPPLPLPLHLSPISEPEPEPNPHVDNDRYYNWETT